MYKLSLLFISFAALLSTGVVQADHICKCLPNNGEAATTGKKKDQCKKPTKFTGPAKGVEIDLVDKFSGKV